MNPYIVVSPPWTHTSSGVRTLHILCDALNRMGHKAYMFPHNGWTYNFAVNKELNTPMAIPEGYYHDPIVIYPEIIMGNPLGGRRVVRYILGQKDNPTFGPDDMLWSCTTALGRKFGTDKIITVPTFDDKIFYNQNRPSRSGACFYSNKYDRLLGYKLLPITEGMTRIQGTVENVAEIYHSHETCYVYEDTEVIFNASLCGLKVILIRTPYFSDLGNQDNEFYSYSGLEWDDGEKINEGMGTVEECLARLHQKFPVHLAKFIEQTQN